MNKVWMNQHFAEMSRNLFEIENRPPPDPYNFHILIELFYIVNENYRNY